MEQLSSLLALRPVDQQLGSLLGRQPHDLERRQDPVLDGQHLRLPGRARRPPALPHLPVPLPEVLAQDGRGSCAASIWPRCKQALEPEPGVLTRAEMAVGDRAPRRRPALRRRPDRAVRRRQGAGASHERQQLPHSRRKDDVRLARDLQLFHVYRFLSTSYLFLPVLVMFFSGARARLHAHRAPQHGLRAHRHRLRGADRRARRSLRPLPRHDARLAAHGHRLRRRLRRAAASGPSRSARGCSRSA